MDLSKRICWSFCVFGGFLVFSAAAAASPSDLQCDVSKEPDGSFLYQLSRPPRSIGCTKCWEHQNGTVITRDSSYKSEGVVQHLTNQSITLKVCFDYLHFRNDCPDFEEAHCRVNCSLLLNASLPIVNSTTTCMFGNWCPDLLKVGLAIGVVVAAVAVGVGLYCWKRRQIRKSMIPYIPGKRDGRIKWQKEGVETVSEKT